MRPTGHPKLLQTARLLGVFLACLLMCLAVCYVLIIAPVINAIRELPDDAFNPGAGLYLMFLTFVSGVVSLVAGSILTLIIYHRFFRRVDLNRLYILGELLSLLRKISVPFGADLYMSGKHPWNRDVACALLMIDKDDDPGALPHFAAVHGLAVRVSGDIPQQVVLNVLAQKDDPSVDDLVKAFNCYWRRDAFIDFSR